MLKEKQDDLRQFGQKQFEMRKTKRMTQMQLAYALDVDYRMISRYETGQAEPGAFSRNVAECKKYTDMLKLKNVIVEFEKEHISTEDTTSSFIFSLMFAIAENESRSISENIRWGYRERFKRGEYNLGNNRILGYDTIDGKLVPNQDADVIRLIYSLFLQGANVDEIIRKLTDIGVTTRKGTPLSRNGILYILKNETYVGDKIFKNSRPGISSARDPIRQSHLRATT